MQIPTKISYRNFGRSEAVEQRIHEKIAKLEKFYDRIVGCTVVVEAPHRHQTKGKLYHVHIVLTLPKGDLVVNRGTEDDHGHEDVYVAIRDAFEAARRQLKRYVRQLRMRHHGDEQATDAPLQP